MTDQEKIAELRRRGVSEDIIAQAAQNSQMMGGMQEKRPTALIGSTLGGIAGGVLGAAGGIPGIIAGGAAGAAAGTALERNIQGVKQSGSELAKEAALGGLAGAGGELLGAGIRVGGKLLGRGAVDVGENLAVKALRPKPSQLAGFAAKHGEDIVPVLQREGLVGKSPEAIRTAIEPIQQQFDDLIAGAKNAIDPKAIRQTFAEDLKPLLNSPDPQDRTIARRVAANLRGVLRSLKTDPSVANLNKLRQLYDSKVNYKLAAQDILRYGEKKIVADALRKSVQQAVGEELAPLGQRLNKLYDISTIADIQEQLGRGSLPVGLLQLLGVGSGAAVGGVPGGVVGFAAQQAINSPLGMRLGSQALTGGGALLAENAAKFAPRGLTQTASQGVVQGADQLFTGGGGQDQGLGVTPLASPAQSSADPMQGLKLAIAADVQKTGGKNISTLVTLWKTLNPTGTTKKTEAQVARDDARSGAEDALAALQSGGIQTGMLAGPAQSFAAKFGAADQPTFDFQTKIAGLKAAIAKARAGSSFTPNEEKLLNKYTPNNSDSYQELSTKLQYLVNFFGTHPDAGVPATLPSTPLEVAF